MKQLQNKVVELKDITIELDGENINLWELTYEEFATLLNTIAGDESLEKHLIQTIIDAIGVEGMLALIDKLTQMELLDDMIEYEDENEEDEDTTKTKCEQEILPPVKFVNMDDFFSYDPSLVVKGIDSVSETVGQYLAFINAGMTSKQAFELITVEGHRKHELVIADKQLEMKRLENDAQVRMASVKQLLNR